MFARILIILGALLCGGAAFLAFQNRNTLASLREQDNDLQTSIKALVVGSGLGSEEIGTGIEEIRATNKSITASDSELGEEKAKGDKLALDIDRKKTELTTLNGEIADKQAKVDALNKELEKLPKGMSIDTLNEDIARIKKEIDDLQPQSGQLTEDITAQKEIGADLQKKLSEILGRLEARKRVTAMNSFSAFVTAVNADFGFVVINAGSSRGITPDTELIVQCATGGVAKVKPFDITSSRTVANILRNATPNLGNIQPGDTVSLAKPITP